jgi:type IV secretion system T-DNA border endonuclease VirD1
MRQEVRFARVSDADAASADGTSSKQERSLVKRRYDTDANSASSNVGTGQCEVQALQPGPRRAEPRDAPSKRNNIVCASASAASGRYKVISLRIRRAEFETFCETVEALGITPNLALRIAVRRIGGFLEVDRDVRNQLEKILVAIGELSGAIRARQATATASGLVEIQSFSDQRILLGAQFAQLDALLRSILNVSKTRIDGARKLQEVAS